MNKKDVQEMIEAIVKDVILIKRDNPDIDIFVSGKQNIPAPCAVMYWIFAMSYFTPTCLVCNSLY